VEGVRRRESGKGGGTNEPEVQRMVDLWWVIDCGSNGRRCEGGSSAVWMGMITAFEPDRDLEFKREWLCR
jgi:hypothetical protein